MSITRTYTIFILLFLVIASSLYGQKELQILDYDLSSYPNVAISYFTFDDNGFVDLAYKDSDFEVLDNGKKVPVIYQNCQNINPGNSASCLLSVDLSIKNDTIDNKADKTINFLRAIIGNINLYNVKAGLHSFNTLAYLNNDITSNQTTLNNSLQTLLFSSGSIIDTGFSSAPLGSIELIKKQEGAKSIIYFSSTFSHFDAEKIIADARVNSIKIFPVFFGRTMPSNLQKLADSTGGFAMLIADSVKNFRGRALSLLAMSLNYSPCNLVWRNNLDCFDLHIETVKIPASNIEDKFAFNTGNKFRPSFSNTPPYLRFSSVSIGSSKTLNVSFQAKNSDITITDLLLHDPRFTIDSGDISGVVVLPRDSSHTVKIRFTPSDSSIVFDSLEIISDACSDKTILITGGYPNTPPSNRTLTLLTPNCGENLIVDDTATVSWTGLLPADVIQLQYSTDNGANWDTLATDITGLKYNWKVPDTESDSCLVRVIQLWPNNIGRTMVLPHKGGVNCANFNRDGSLVVTASNDQKFVVRIWNANNGQLLEELAGHNKAVNWVNFDPKDQYAISASDDSTIKLWDIKKAELVRTLRGHHDAVRAANFDNTGNFIISASKDGHAFLWETETGKLIDSTTFRTGNSLWFAAFSPDGKYIVITDDQGLAIVYDANTKQVFNSYNSGSGVIPYASFNNDMTKLATAGWFGQSIVWDFVSGSKLFSVTHDTTKIVPINSSTFDNTGQYLLTAGADTVPRLWDANTGKQITTLLNEHTSSVQIATFNFDGKRILTASWDSTAKVWNREQIGLQVDTSDCVFSIKKLHIDVQDIKFADTPLGTIRDSLIIPFITNSLDFPIDVRAYNISGANPSDFEVINNLPPHIIDSAGYNYIEVRFKPSALGLREAVLDITLPGTIKSIKLSGNGTNGALKLTSSVVDFGHVEIGDYKDSSVTLINNSGQPVLIDSVVKLGPDFLYFNITSNISKNILQPGDRLEIPLRFIPENENRVNSVFRIFNNGRGKPLDLSLFGDGTQPRIDTATIVIGNAVGKPGDIVEVPIKITNISNLGILPTITGFNITIKFNSTLLEPINATTNTIENGQRRLEISLPAIFGEDSVLQKMNFRVGLGNDTATALQITELSLVGDGKMVLYGQDGLFKLSGYCKNGGDRLFESEGRIYLEGNVPNPVTDYTEITFGIIERGQTKLYLTDVLGNTIQTLVSAVLRPGVYSYQIDANTLPTGKIFYILQTPTKILVKSMDIIK